MQESTNIESLFNKYLDGTITRQEFNEFFQLLKEHDINALSPQLQTLWLQTEGIAPFYTDEEWNSKLKTLIHKAEQEDEQREGRKERKGRAKNAKLIPIYWRWIAAACILLVVGVLALEHYVGVPANNHRNQVATTHDVPAPTNTRAVITLANGSKVYLDSVTNGTIAQENNVNVIKNSEGGISYVSAAGEGGMSPAGEPVPQQREGGSKETGVDYNTLFNPRGSKVISLTLSDGTKVWLNSESSLKYPIAFNANTREVEITGEAYFEVKHNSKQPFKVHLPNGSVVEDIGTSFNINAYNDETDIKTTLIEGSVRVVGGDANKVLKPGQQALINQANPLILPIKVQTVDANDVTAWVHGNFSFNNTDLKSIMRQLTRWYDVDVVYEGDAPERYFTADISREKSLSGIMKILEASGIHFKIEGRKIVIMK